jgi:predicted hydrocarbon binding protein
MSEIEIARQELQDAMSFLGALSSGLENFIGRAANGMAFVAGKNLGKKYCQGTEQTADLERALQLTDESLKKYGFLWKFESWSSKGQPLITTSDSGKTVIKLVFRDCMIRQSLFRYGHEQKGSLCYMMYGFFSGALETILGKKTKLDILHTGENACLKELTIET